MLFWLKNKYGPLVMLLFVSLTNYAQNADCIDAFPICSNATLPFDVSGVGNIVEDIEAPDGCLLDQNATKWLRFKAATSGTLTFVITPENDIEDYDFAVFGPNVPCNDLGVALRSSFSFVKGPTGLAINAGNDCQSSNGDRFVNAMQVTAGEEYYLMIDNFTAITGNPVGGFEIEWGGTASLDCTIVCKIELGENKTVCIGGFVDIDATTPNATGYLWSNGATSEKIRVDQPGTYSVDVAFSNQCIATDQITVNFVAPPQAQDVIFETCDLGEGRGEFYLQEANETISIQQNLTFTYHNTMQDASLNRNELATPFVSSPRLIYARVASGEDCFTVSEVDLQLTAINRINEPEIALCYGETAVLTDGQIIRQTGIYEQAEDRGCTLRIFPYNFEVCEAEYCSPRIPAAFAPNGNGNNETLKMLTPFGCSLIINNFKIYNRWGELVFEGTGINSSWDGQFNNYASSNSIFLWIVDYEFIDEDGNTGSGIAKGTSYLLK